MIRIRSTQKRGFWRLGRHFTEGAQEFPDGIFSPEELAALEAEPMLVVQRLAEPERPAAGPQPKPAGPATSAQPKPAGPAADAQPKPATTGDQAQGAGDVQDQEAGASDEGEPPAEGPEQTKKGRK